MQELRGGGGRDVLAAPCPQAGGAGLPLSADAVLVLAPAACRAIWECSRAALVIRLASRGHETARLSYNNKNLRRTSPEAMLDFETWVCEENDTASPES